MVKKYVINMRDKETLSTPKALYRAPAVDNKRKPKQRKKWKTNVEKVSMNFAVKKVHDGKKG